MALFAELIVMFDLSLLEEAQGNEVFGQGFPWKQSLPHNLESRRKRKKGAGEKGGKEVKENSARLRRAQGSRTTRHEPKQQGGSATQ